MLVEAAWVAVKTPGPLRAFFERVRSCRGMQIAVVAIARKLAVLCWTMIERGADYAFARPSLTDKKLRALELRAGMPSRRCQKGKAAAYALKEVRRREREPAEQAERAYHQHVADWQSKRLTKPKPEPGVAAAYGTRLKGPLWRASCAAGISPRTYASLGGRPRPEQSLTPTQASRQARPSGRGSRTPALGRTPRRVSPASLPASDVLADTNLRQKHGTTARPQTLKLRRGLDTFIRPPHPFPVHQREVQVRDELVDVVDDHLRRGRVGAFIVSGKRGKPGLRLADRGRVVQRLPLARLGLGVMTLG
jgi:hypothetical protein